MDFINILKKLTARSLIVGIGVAKANCLKSKFDFRKPFFK